MPKQYIDKDDLLNGIYSENPKDIMKYIADFPTAGTHVEIVKRVPGVYDALEDYLTDTTHVDDVMRMIADISERKLIPGYKFVYEVWSEKIWNTPKE